MQTENNTETKKTTGKPRREKKFFAWVEHRQINAETGKPSDPEFLELSDKAKLREVLGRPQYEGCNIRIVRGHEMIVKTDHRVIVN